MGSFLAQAEDFGSLLFWLLFILLPLLGRLARWIQERAQGTLTQGSAPAEPEAREEGEPEELAGAELWRRLLAGESPAEARSPASVEEASPPVMPAPVPSFEAPSREPASAMEARRAALDPGVAEDEIFARPLVERTPVFPRAADAPEHLAAEAAPLSGLGPTLLTSAAPRSSDRGAVGELGRRLEGFPEEGEEARPESAAAGAPGPAALRNALLWSVVLAPPLALTGSPADHEAP